MFKGQIVQTPFKDTYRVTLPLFRLQVYSNMICGYNYRFHRIEAEFTAAAAAGSGPIFIACY